MSPRRGNVCHNDEDTRVASRLDGHNSSSSGGGSALSASQFATSNSTMNTFLGGKQKSWMTQGNNGVALPLTPATSKGRGPKSTAARNSLPLCERINRTPSTSIPLQQSFAPLPTPQPQPQPPSNSTSPLIANTLHPRQDKVSAGYSTQEGVLPSPAPSEEALPDFPGQLEASAIGSRNEYQLPTGNVTPLEKSGGINVDAQSQPDLGKELNELVSRYGVEEVEKLLRSSNGPQSSLEASITPIPSTVSVAFQPLPAPPTQSAPSVPQKRPSVPSMVQDKRQRVLTAPSSAQTPTGVTLNSSLGSPVQPVQPMAPNDQTSIGSFTPVGPGSSLKLFLPKIDQHITEYGGESALGSVELPRIRVLQDACQSEDCFYLTLHQIFCLHSLNPKAFFEIPGMTQIHVMGLGIVEQLVLPNRHLPPKSIAWFASFPTDHSTLVARSSMYQRALKEVQNFLYLITQNWRRIQEGCRQRDYPPLVEELVTNFGLVSVVFQRIVFTAIHRSIWGSEPQGIWFRRVELLFRQDQQKYQENRSRMNTARPPTLTEIRAGQDALVSKYKEIRQQRRQSVLGETTQSPASLSFATNPQQISQNTSAPLGVVSSPHTGNAASSLGNPSTGLLQERSHVIPTVRTTFTHSPSVLQSSDSGGNASSRRPPRLNINTQPVSIAAASRTAFTAQPQNIPPAQTRDQARSLAQSSRIPNSCTTFADLTSGQIGRPVPHPQLASQPSRSHPTANQLLIPSLPFVAPMQPHPNPSVTSLHQAHLRSPTFHPIAHVADDDGAPKLYSFVRECVLPPKAIDLTRSLYSWSFQVSESDIKQRAVDFPSSTGGPARRDIVEGSRMYRLRCAKVISAEDLHDESKWVVMENIWPSHAFLKLNSHTIELRRKQQHGKDLPADLTSFVNEENRLSLSIIRTDQEKAGIFYAFAVEVVEVTTGSKVRQGLTATGRLPANDILESIKACLSVNINDEDIAVVNSNLTIQLNDPFTARIFNFPIRSTACLHRECFDLDTFLQTRKSKRPEWPCMPEEWRCPICGSDARPQVLRVDGFLLEVRASLAKQNLLETRAIVVEEDGSWQPKAEKKENDPTGRARGSETPASSTRATAPMSPTKQTVVIDLESD
ncbi:MAG: hypothetical protein M1812_003611 [Candelaria pacifica]|nr:MAG: hypothetical protein M1812_003611 [Candelaria pacifica]